MNDVIINKKHISQEKLNQLVKDVREKKDCSTLGTEFIKDHAKEYLRLNRKALEEFSDRELSSLIKSATYQTIIKLIRAKARTIVSVFIDPTLINQRRELMKKTSIENDENILNILNSHMSTKERIEIYSDFYEQVFAITGKPKKILDLACGINPVAYYYKTQNKKTIYVASELSEIDCADLQSFFDYNKLDAKAIPLNLVKNYEELQTNHDFNQQFDVCFLLKALDTCESQKMYVTYDILSRINAKFLVVSFPLKSVKGIQMERSAIIHWFEKMLPRMNMTFKKIEFEHEVIYIVQKQPS